MERLPQVGNAVALTFDAGANADGAPSILQTLTTKDVPATFFLTGRFAEREPTIARRIATSYVIGNHTQNHPDLTALTDAAVREDILTGQRTLTRITGQDPRRFFRFPFGARDSRVIRIANSLCYVPFRWTVDTLGWKGTSGDQSVATVISRVMDALVPGQIVLMHLGSNPDDGTTLDADALPAVIDRIRARGYSFVTLADALGDARP